MGLTMVMLFTGGCSPSPSKICNRLATMAPASEFSMAECLTRESALRGARSSSWYSYRGRCIMRQATYTGALSCRGRHTRRRRGRVVGTTIRVGSGKKKVKRRKRKRKR